ncbi:glycoside hydrolase family 3 N-terminal domain-containing protein [Bauldia sp.]|uniref:glycoside hydrolase family 3 N-terminal domain-containing protein n=1 Tax=Bauldia sp. TaxID=2575872 RepID=UPI003BACBC2A
MRSGPLHAALSAAFLALSLTPTDASSAASRINADAWRAPAQSLHPDRQIELLERKIGQMLVIGFPGTRADEVWSRRAISMLDRSRIGGVILFGHNVRNRDQLSRLTERLNAGGGPPPFVAIDQEGGQIQRLNRRKGFTRLASAKSIANGSLCDAYAAYWATARELARFGINVSLGPVVDLNINPRNPAIGRLGRSYGTDPATVVGFATQFIDAHATAGVLTAAKHFPGHGSAVRDPHHRVVDITTTWQPNELEPFSSLASDDEVAMIMVGHLIHPRFSDGTRPTSLSRRTLTEALRDDLGFNGLIVTDDLGMDAITERYGPEEAAVMAVRAGADLLIYANQKPDDGAFVDDVIAAIAAAAVSGRIPISMIDRAQARILETKRRLSFVPAEGDDTQPMSPAVAPIGGSFTAADVAAMTAKACRPEAEPRGDG